MGDRTVTFGGRPAALTGTELKVGDPAPDFTAVGQDLKEVAFPPPAGQVLVISSVPSLDTPVCDMETRRFNVEAGKLGDAVRVVTVSMDLPFAQKRWCGAAGIDRVLVVSDHRDASFGRAYGVLIEEARLLARSVFVVDSKGVIRYIQLVKETGREPDYEEVLAEVRKLL